MYCFISFHFNILHVFFCSLILDFLCISSSALEKKKRKKDDDTAVLYKLSVDWEYGLLAICHTVLLVIHVLRWLQEVWLICVCCSHQAKLTCKLHCVITCVVLLTWDLQSSTPGFLFSLFFEHMIHILMYWRLQQNYLYTYLYVLLGILWPKFVT